MMASRHHGDDERARCLVLHAQAFGSGVFLQLEDLSIGVSGSSAGLVLDGTYAQAGTPVACGRYYSPSRSALLVTRIKMYPQGTQGTCIWVTSQRWPTHRAARDRGASR